MIRTFWKKKPTRKPPDEIYTYVKKIRIINDEGEEVSLPGTIHKFSLGDDGSIDIHITEKF